MFPFRPRGSSIQYAVFSQDFPKIPSNAVNTFWRVLSWKNVEKRPFFRAAMTGLGKYHMGGYGQIGVYRDYSY